MMHMFYVSAVGMWSEFNSGFDFEGNNNNNNKVDI